MLRGIIALLNEWGKKEVVPLCWHGHFSTLNARLDGEWISQIELQYGQLTPKSTSQVSSGGSSPGSKTLKECALLQTKIRSIGLLREQQEGRDVIPRTPAAPSLHVPEVIVAYDECTGELAELRAARAPSRWVPCHGIVGW